MDCYLDNSATTQVFKEAADAVYRLMCEDYGNPSSMHRRGFEAEKELKAAREGIAKILKCTEGEIYFTSGGTESNNLAIIGAAEAYNRQGKHLITTEVEHASVLAPMKRLEEMGYEVTYLGVDSKGSISLEELREAVREDTILVSIMHVNNEIGAAQPIAEAGRIIKEKNPKCLFHVDDIQGFGKLRLYPKRMNIDLLSVSGHKIHGPKGTGILYKNKDVRLITQIYGGGQQQGMRSGTENVPGYVGFGVAATMMYRNINAATAELYTKRKYFVERLAALEGVRVNGIADAAFYKDNEGIYEADALEAAFAPHIISLSIDDVRAEVMLHALEDKGVYVSAGSACSSNKPSVSRTLKAIAVEDKYLDSTIRLSLSVHTSTEEIDYAVECLGQLLPMLRRFTRK